MVSALNRAKGFREAVGDALYNVIVLNLSFKFGENYAKQQKL